MRRLIRQEATMSDSKLMFCAAADAIPAHPLGHGVTARAALLNPAFWGRSARLTIAFLEGEPALHRRVATLAQRWLTETGADIQFEFWIDISRDPRDANLRIAFRPDKGSYSILGKYALQADRSLPTMNLGWMSLQLDEEQARAVVLHEFGHALGLIHEHLSPAQTIDWNVANVVADLRRTQGWNDKTIQANMFAHYDPATVFATDIDPQSIMMYPIPPHWTNNGFTVGFNSLLTAQDKALVKEAYGRRPFGAT
jgi:serralysin